MTTKNDSPEDNAGRKIFLKTDGNLPILLRRKMRFRISITGYARSVERGAPDTFISGLPTNIYVRHIFTAAPTATEKTDRCDLPTELRTAAVTFVKPTGIRAKESVLRRGTATETPAGSPPKRI